MFFRKLLFAYIFFTCSTMLYAFEEKDSPEYSASGNTENHDSDKQPVQKRSVRSNQSNSANKIDRKVRFRRDNYTETVQAGNEALLKCPIKNDTEVAIFWLKLDKDTNKEQEITINYTTVHMDKRFKQTNRNKSNNWDLSIKYTQKSDEGIYACRVFLHEFSISLYVTLDLIEAVAQILVTDDEEPGKIKVKLFSPLRLSCVINKSISHPQYIFWYHFDTMINYDLEDNASVRHGRQGSELIFPKTEQSHQGNYSCVPSNARQASIVVEVYGESALIMSINRAERGESYIDYFNYWFLIGCQIHSFV